MENPNKQKPSPLRKYIILITYAILLFVLIYRIDSVWNGVKWVLNAISPLFAGIGLAYLFHMPMNFFQHKLLKGWQHHTNRVLRGMWRGMSMLLAYLSVLLVIFGLVALVLPRAVESVGTLMSNFSSYLASFQSWADGFMTSLSVDPDTSSMVSNIWGQAVELLQTFMSQVVGAAVNFTVSLTSGVTNFVLAIMFSGFLLYNKGSVLAQIRRLFAALIGEKRVRKIAGIAHLSDNILTRFIMGKIVDSLLLGAMCFLCMTIFQMEYAFLISVVIAATALVPIIGPIVGTIVCALLLLVINPSQAVGFVIMILVVQQIEGNAIYPRLMGNAIGLSGLWVLVSVIIGGGLFGIWGMLLGTPVFAVCYHLVERWLDERQPKS